MQHFQPVYRASLNAMIYDSERKYDSVQQEICSLRRAQEELTWEVLRLIDYMDRFELFQAYQTEREGTV